MDFRTYRVQPRDRAPLLAFILKALEAAGCQIIHRPSPETAPFRITYQAPIGERAGIVAYAFFANTKVTRNRPLDEHRFQLKYGSKDGRLHKLWQDPYGLYTTVLLGIDPDLGLFIGADPVLHSPTKFFISIEFKAAAVKEILARGWHVWERDRRATEDQPAEVLVGGTAPSLLRYLTFERAALGEDQGHRHLIAEQLAPASLAMAPLLGPQLTAAPPPVTLHALSQELDLSEGEVLDLIAGARRLKMAVRGWVAELHLRRRLATVPGVTDCIQLDEEGAPDVELRFEGSRPLRIECKNVLRQQAADGTIRLDFQRTRASKRDPCSRYYGPREFDVVAACLHAVTEQWQYRYTLPTRLDHHPRCVGKLASNVRLDQRWEDDATAVLRHAAATAG
jgi:hypothetical protein